jgi:hypothetical protein
MSDLVGSGETPDSIGNSDAFAPSQVDQTEDEAKLVAETNSKYAQWRNDKRPLEGGWFVNAAMMRGLNNTRWNPTLNVLESRAPSHRSRDNFNIIAPKVKAKLSKFLKMRAIPVVTPSSTDHEDILNAQATTKLLEYLWPKLQLEELYEEALLWSMQTGKSFWWFRWKETALAQVKKPAGFLSKESVEDVPLGDVEVELGTVFELLVSDPGVTRIGKQPEIMRVKTRLVKELESNYQLAPGIIEGDTAEGDLFQYQKQIAQLGSRATVGSVGKSQAKDEDAKKYVIVKELFTAPNATYPNGRYIVVAGAKLLHQSDSLPYGFASFSNPYPVVEFADTVSAGQFWPTTMIEQLIPGQTRFNRYNNQVDEHLKLNTNPKMMIPKQAQVPEGAFNSEAGQTIPINWQPGMPNPDQWIIRPPAINGDIWKAMDNLLGLNDMISNLYPASLGGGGATSGFDTNLLQEAADSVHAPDIRRNNLALRDAAFKIRRIVKLGYDIPRLITIIGRDKQPEVFEFSQEQIDEHANIVIDEGSSLPSLKHARIEAILKLDERQLFGAPTDPQRNRRVMRMLELGTQEEANDMQQRDENHARLENLSFTRNEPVEDPMPWENHDIEYEVHTDLLKSSEIKSWPPEQRATLVRHTILHVKWKNPMNALQLAAVFGMQDVVMEIKQTMMVQQQATAMMPPQPGVGPGQAPPQQAPAGPPPQGPPVQ